MSASIQRASVGEPGSGPEREDASSFVSIEPFFRLLARYHRVLLFGIAVLVVVWLAAVLFLRSSFPGVTTSSIGIRFAFQGVASNKYPNELPFSPNDVIAPEVLEQVYVENDLKDVLPFERFKKSVFISQFNRDLEQLESEYAIKLRDSRLSSPERRALEKEFSAAANGLRTDSYLLTYRADGRSRLPATLSEKVLLDIPATWARLAAERRGVLSYDVEIATIAPVTDAGASVEKTLQTVELLRLTTGYLREAASKIAELPGARLARGNGGDTVADLTTEIDVFSSLTVMPRYFAGIQMAAATNRALVESLLSARLESERRVQAARDARAADLERALHVYLSNATIPDTLRDVAPADAGAAQARNAAAASQGGSGVIAQVGGSFIEEIVRARDAAQDIKYRQELNDKMLEAKAKAVEAASNVKFSEYLLAQVREGAAQDRGQAAQFSQDAAATADTLRGLSERLRAVYEGISQRNLNPESTLYTIDRPFFSVRSWVITWSDAILGGFGFVTLGTIALIIGCALHDRRRRLLPQAV